MSARDRARWRAEQRESARIDALSTLEERLADAQLEIGRLDALACDYAVELDELRAELLERDRLIAELRARLRTRNTPPATGTVWSRERDYTKEA